MYPSFPYKIDIWDKILLAAYATSISPSSFRTDPALRMVSGEARLTQRTSQHPCSWRITEGSLEHSERMELRPAPPGPPPPHDSRSRHLPPQGGPGREAWVDSGGPTLLAPGLFQEKQTSTVFKPLSPRFSVKHPTPHLN